MTVSIAAIESPERRALRKLWHAGLLRNASRVFVNA